MLGLGGTRFKIDLMYRELDVDQRRYKMLVTEADVYEAALKVEEALRDVVMELDFPDLVEVGEYVLGDDNALVRGLAEALENWNGDN